jgi:hypothetical protein
MLPVRTNRFRGSYPDGQSRYYEQDAPRSH